MEPSTSAEFCENGNIILQEAVPNPRYSDCTETYPAPPSNLCIAATVNEEDGQEHEAVPLVSCQSWNIAISCDNDIHLLTVSPLNFVGHRQFLFLL